MAQSYQEYVNELLRYPMSTTIRTDFSTLHCAMNKLLHEGGYDHLGNIDNIEIIDNDETANAVDSLVKGCLAGYAIRGDTVFDHIENQFMLGNITYKLSRFGDRPKRISVDIVLVHTEGLENNLIFKDMIESMSSCQRHRTHT